MISPAQGMIKPYLLDDSWQLFVDWRYVRPGMIRWDGEGGKKISLFGTEGVQGNVYPAPLDVPHNLRVCAFPAQKSGPLLSPDQPWEQVIFWPTLMQDGGKYRLWYEAVPGAYWAGKATAHEPGWGDLLCYAESDDLQTWHKPDMGIQHYEGLDSNIVLGGDLCPGTGYHGGAVFVDPSARSEERYKVIYMGRIQRDELQAAERHLGLEADTMALHYQCAMFAAVSPDGIHWRNLPEPVMLANSDTGNRVHYDPASGKYIGYFRMWLYGRRAIGRSETDDFTRWPLPHPVLWVTPGDSPSLDIYTNAKTILPGNPNQHLMFAAHYLRNTDTTEIHLASSQEDYFWSWLPGEAVLTTGPAGSWDAGCLFAGGDLVKCSDGSLALPYVGYPVPHKYPRSMRLGQIGLATWQANRLAAIQVPEVGSFTTQQMIFQGGSLELNVETRRAGEIRVEIAESDGAPLPIPLGEDPAVLGRAFEDCDPITGDLPAHTVTWKGSADLSALAGKPVTLRFSLRAANLFAFRFK